MMQILVGFALLTSDVKPLENPSLAKRITIAGTLLTVPEVLGQITEQTGVKTAFSVSVQPLKLNVFVKNQPADKVMRWIASALECEWVSAAGSPKLSLDIKAKTERDTFLTEEHKLLVAKVREQAATLAKLSQYPFGQTPLAAEGDPEVWRWGCQKVREAPWYVAGMQHRINGAWMKCFYGGQRTNETYPYSFTVDEPLDAFGAWVGYCAIDANSQSLRDTTVATMADYSYGELSVRSIVGPEPVQDPDSRDVIRYLRPAAELERLSYSKRLATWESDEGLPDKALQADLAIPKPYPSGCYGLGDQLRILSEGADVPIVADAFRVPLHRKKLLTQGTVDYAIDELRESEGLFARWEDGALLVRHGGFWRLCLSEPSEGPFRVLEQTERPTLDQYADAMGSWMGGPHGLNGRLNRLRSPVTLLLRADTKPIYRHGIALTFYASLTEPYKKRLHAGRSMYLGASYYMRAAGGGLPLKTRYQFSGYRANDNAGIRKGMDTWLSNLAYLYAPLFEAQFQGRMRYKALPFYASFVEPKYWGAAGIDCPFVGQLSKEPGKPEEPPVRYDSRIVGCPLVEYLAQLYGWQELPWRRRIGPYGSMDGTLGRYPKRTGEFAITDEGLVSMSYELELRLLHPALYVSLRSVEIGGPGHGSFTFWFGNEPQQGVVYQVYIP